MSIPQPKQSRDAWLAFFLARALANARREHRQVFPDSNYKAANIALGGLREIASCMFPATFGLGNEETIRWLEEFVVDEHAQ